MTEHLTEPTEQAPQPGREALPLNDAAALEGVAPDALRMRLRRGKVEGYRDAAGHVFIYRDSLTEQRPNSDRTPTEQRPNSEPPAIVAELRRQLERLEAREAELMADLRAERERAAEERRRADILIQGAQQSAALASEQAARSLALIPAPGEIAAAGTPPPGQPLALTFDRTRPTLSTAEAAAMLGRSPRTLARWASREDAPLHPLPIPGPHRWSTAEVARLTRTDPPPEPGE